MATEQRVEGALKELRADMLALGSEDGVSELSLYRLIHRPYTTTPQQEQIIQEALSVVLEQTRFVANLAHEFAESAR